MSLVCVLFVMFVCACVFVEVNASPPVLACCEVVHSLYLCLFFLTKTKHIIEITASSKQNKKQAKKKKKKNLLSFILPLILPEVCLSHFRPSRFVLGARTLVALHFRELGGNKPYQFDNFISPVSRAAARGLLRRRIQPARKSPPNPVINDRNIYNGVSVTC